MESSARYLPAEERRAVTIRTVIELAGSHNPSEISTSAIARRMHLTQGALFRHFASKEALWQATMEWVRDQLLARIDQAAHTGSSPLEGLEAMFMSHIEFIIEHPGVPRILFGELQRAEPTPAKQVAQTIVERYTRLVCARIEAGKATGAIAAEVDTGSAALLFLGAVQGLVIRSLLSGDLQRLRSQAPGVFTLFRRALRSAS